MNASLSVHIKARQSFYLPPNTVYLHSSHTQCLDAALALPHTSCYITQIQFLCAVIVGHSFHFVSIG